MNLPPKIFTELIVTAYDQTKRCRKLYPVKRHMTKQNDVVNDNHLRGISE